MTISDDIIAFYYGNTVFSNFYRICFTYCEREFFCSEQALMWAKAATFGDWDIATEIINVNPAIRNAAFACKMLGRKVSGYDDAYWSGVRQSVMTDILIAKFGQSHHAWQELDATGDRLIVEASPTDRIWGVGLGEDHPDILKPDCYRGLNLLGQSLMRARTYLRQSS